MASTNRFKSICNCLGMNRDPMMQRPGGDYTGPDSQGNYPEVEEPIMATAAEEQEFTNPFAGMFGDSTPQRGSMYENDEKMAKYQDSFSRRISNLEGDAAVSAFLDAVRSNDVDWVEDALKSKDITSPVKSEDHRRAALIIAIKNRHIDMVKLLLEYDAPIGNSFFHAVDASSTPVVRVLCDHLKGKKAILDSAVNSFSEDPDFPSITTPLMMASCENELEIVELLIGVGAQLPTLEAVLARVESSHDIYERALARLHWHKAMSTEAYLLFSSDDPVKAAFDAGHMIVETAKDQLTHIKPDYKELRQGLDRFLTNYLDMTQNTLEIGTILSGQRNKDGNGGMTKSLPRRLIYALDLKFQSFVAHNNCQQYVLDRWYLYHQEWEELPMLHFCLRTALIFILMPFLCVLYIIFPLRGVKAFMKMPFVRFVLQMASRLAFLAFLMYATMPSETDERIAGAGDIGEIGPTKSPEDINRARVEHYLLYRGEPGHFVIWLIYIWILGMTWREVKEVWRQGPKEYLSEPFNFVDILQLVLYWIAIILTFVSYIKAISFVKSEKWETWDTCADKAAELGSLSEFEEPEEEARSVRAIFECEARTDWSPYDPLLVAEGCFALATVLTFLGALRDTVILSFVGPLRISLGGMIVDIVRFFVLFFFLWISFAIGLTQLYETFMVLKTLECEEGEDCHPAFLTFQRTLGTLFWSLFDLADTEELEVHPSAGMLFTENVGLLLYASYLVIAVVVMLNALIAMMSNTYTRVEENTAIQWKVERTKLMVDYMVNCPTLPAPFNLVPTPKSFVLICKRLYNCCFMRSSLKRKKLDAARDQSERENKYKLFIQLLTDRYISNLRSGQIEDDDNERLLMDVSNLKEILRMMRHQMRDIQSDNRTMHKNVENCVRNMDDMVSRQKRMEEQQRKQLKLLKSASQPPSGAPTPPPVSPSPPPQRAREEDVQADVAPLEEADRDIRELTRALEDMPWIDSEV